MRNGTINRAYYHADVSVVSVYVQFKELDGRENSTVLGRARISKSLIDLSIYFANFIVTITIYLTIALLPISEFPIGLP